MTIRDAIIGNFPLKLLSLALAAALWSLAAGAKEDVADLSVPVVLRNVPPGFTAVVRVPSRVHAAVAGSRLRLLGLRPHQVSLELDLKNQGEGIAFFGGIEKRLRVPAGFEVLRVHPSTVEVRLERVTRNGAGMGENVPTTPGGPR